MYSNSYWYYGLGIISLIIFGFTYYKKRSSKTILTFLIMVECAYIIETVIYIFLESYQYHPNIIDYNAYYDSNIGSIFSNLFAVPTIATLIGAFQLKWRWMGVFTVIFALIELWFIRLQIYTLNWWRVEYTSLGLLLVYFPLAKLIYKKLLYPIKGFLHTLFLILCLAPIVSNFLIFPIMFLHNKYYIVGWFESIAHDTTAFASIYYLVICMIMTILIMLDFKYKWIRYVLLGIIMFAITVLLSELNILYSLVWWDPWYSTLAPLVILRIGEAISDRLAKAS